MPCCRKSCPKGLAFSNLNKALKKKEYLQALINASFRQCGLKDTVMFADKLQEMASVWRPAPVYRGD